MDSSPDHYPDHYKAWVRHFQVLTPGDITVKKYYDEDESHSIHIVTSRQADGLVAATIGLMEVDQSQNPSVSAPSEVIMDSRGDLPELQNILATIAFFIIKADWRIRPGVVFEQLVELYRPDLSLPHVYFTAPFQWRSGMTRVELPDRTVYPLLALPISGPESRFIESASDDALESLWESELIDVLDWGRSSAV